MTFRLLPATNDFPWYRLLITMTDVVYTIRMRYNTRMQRWILDIADPANNDILTGLPLLVSRDVNGQYVTDGLPPGTIFVSDDQNQGNQATRYSFGTTHSLVYAEA